MWRKMTDVGYYWQSLWCSFSLKCKFKQAPVAVGSDVRTTLQTALWTPPDQHLCLIKATWQVIFQNWGEMVRKAQNKRNFCEHRKCIDICCITSLRLFVTSFKKKINYYVVTNSQVIYIKAKRSRSASCYVRLYLGKSYGKTLAQPQLVEYGLEYKCVLYHKWVSTIHALSKLDFTGLQL